jgi:hypothetical protein
MRKYLRQIAKARMKALGVKRINRKMRWNRWKQYVFGKYAEMGERAQIGIAMTRKQNRVLKRLKSA